MTVVHQTFSGPDAVKIVGITYRQLDHWARTGLVEPEIPAEGSGTQRRYSYTDLIRLRVVRQLKDAGVSVQKVREAKGYLDELGDDLGSADLVFTGDALLVLRDDGQILDLCRRGQLAMFVPVTMTRQELDARIVELGLAQSA